MQCTLNSCHYWSVIELLLCTGFPSLKCKNMNRQYITAPSISIYVNIAPGLI